MATSTTTKAARQAARKATLAAQEAVLRRTQQNTESLTVFFSARGQAEGIADRLAETIAAAKAAAARQDAQLQRRAGGALAEMRDRGETVTAIAELAGISPKQVRDLIRLSESGGGDDAAVVAGAGSPAPAGAEAGPAEDRAGGTSQAGRVGVVDPEAGPASG